MGTRLHTEHLAFLFWPETTEAQARNNLRQAFPPLTRFLEACTQTLHWRPITPFGLDVAEFEQAPGKAAAHLRTGDPPPCRQRLNGRTTWTAVTGCYDEWVGPQRERLRNLHLQAMEHLLHLREEQGELTDAIHTARRLFALNRDPAHATRTVYEQWIRQEAPASQAPAPPPALIRRGREGGSGNACTRSGRMRQGRTPTVCW